MAIEAVVFDLYDTLVWPDWTVLVAGRDALAAWAGVQVEALRDQWRLTHLDRMRGTYGSLSGDLCQMLNACGSTPSQALLKHLASLEERNWSQGVHLYPDTLPHLALLRQRGLRLAIVSNASREAGAVIGAFGLDRAVDAVILSCEVGALKPDPAILLIALERLGGVPAQAALLVDDVPANLDTAAELGMQTLLMARPDRPAPAAEARDGAHRAHRVISRLDELWPALAALDPAQPPADSSGTAQPQSNRSADAAQLPAGPGS